MELRDYIRILRAHWVGVVAIALAVLLLAAVWTFTRDKVYAADASGFVSTGVTRDPTLASVNDSLAKSRAVSYVEIAESRAVAQRVIKGLDLEDSPSTLIGRIDVSQTVDTVNLKITARADTPVAARSLADEWVKALAAEVDSIEDPENENLPGIPQVTPVVDAALPTTPVSPQPARNLALGLVIGVLLGFSYAVVRSVLDRRLRSADAVTAKFDTNVVGTVPASDILGRKQGQRAQVALSTHEQDRSGAGEAFRKLRTNLTYMDVDNPPRVIVVTSPRPGDGKSTVSMNLAAAIAASGQRVILVDADLRRPTIAASLGLVEGVGLTDVLVGKLPEAEALQSSGHHENLSIMAAGRVPPNPSELLGSQAMQALVHRLSADAMVILDAPPLLPVTDAAVLTAKADGALIVISAGSTLDTELETSLQHLGAVNGRALGVILNKVPRKGVNGGYNAGYYAGDYTSEQAGSTPEAPRHRRAHSSESPRPSRTEGSKDAAQQ